MKKKILIIERDEDVLAMIAHLLVEEGYEVITSSTEFGIFELIRREKPHIILLDMLKSTIQGASLSRAIKAAEGVGEIPIIPLSLSLNNHNECTQNLDLMELLQVVESHSDKIKA